MGLDITLGALVLISAIRGWFKGFLKQAIPLGALIGCVYLADPIRDLARPHALKSFPSIGPEVMNRLLWWTAATVSYVVVAGIGLMTLRSMRKRTYGDPEPDRADQGAGFTLGAIKGAILASFLAWGISEIGPKVLAPVPYVAEQAKTSQAMRWSEQYRPARVIWLSTPVQNFVARVKDRGIRPGPAREIRPDVHPEAPKTETARPSGPSEPVKTASGRPRTLSLPRLNPESPEFLRDLEDAMRREGLSPDWR